MKKIVLLAFVLVLLSVSMLNTQLVITVSASTTHDVYPGQLIQDAINSAESGDTIFVHNGTYIENVVVNKTVSLIGEDKYNTIIDGNGTGNVINVTVNNVNIHGFTVQNSGYLDVGIYVDHSSGSNVSHNIITDNHYGIRLYSSNNSIISRNIAVNQHGYFCKGISLSNSKNCVISDNTAYGNGDGIELGSSNNNTLTDNEVVSNDDYGIELYGSDNNILSSNNVSSNKVLGADGIWLQASSHNTLINNTVSDNDNIGIGLQYYSSDNILIGNIISGGDRGIYVRSSGNIITCNNISRMIVLYTSALIFHNNFFCTGDPNIKNVNWDNDYPSGGNYWSIYDGVDFYSGPNQNVSGSDGIGDTPYAVGAPYYSNLDRYPLMGPISFFNTGTWDEITYYVHTVSNSTVSDFYFSEHEKLISFSVTGTDSTVGFCRVAIPNELLWCDNPQQWQVWVNNTLIENRKVMEDGDYIYIYFNYNQSTQNVEVIGVHVIPEFPTWALMLLVLIVLTVAVIIYKRRLLKTPIH